MPAPTSSSPRVKRMAAAQVESVWLDLPGGIAKTKELIRDAKAQGADFLVLPELWLPGYPVSGATERSKGAHMSTYSIPCMQSD